MTPIIFIPGIGADAHMFDPVVARLEPAFECIGWDLPGYGSTPLRGAYGFADLARWLADDLDALGHDSAFVLGHSIGGMAALEFAHSFPDRLEGLILSGTTPAFGSRDGSLPPNSSPIASGPSTPAPPWRISPARLRQSFWAAAPVATPPARRKRCLPRCGRTPIARPSPASSPSTGARRSRGSGRRLC
jgi:pimeloyl-ACP methyl ester carboxylesterase